MIDVPKPEKGTLAWHFFRWFNDNVNFCHGWLYDSGLDKPDNPVYNWFYDHWLWPFRQNGCLCCNAVRGLIYGFAAGFLFGRFF